MEGYTSGLALAVALLKTGNSTTSGQAKTLSQALVARFGSTYCGRLAQTLLDNWPAR